MNDKDLDQLEREGIITKSATTSTTRCEYSLTEKGSALMPILRDMEAWSATFEPVTA